MNRVKDKVAIVTGGARGLGKACALLLAKEGAKIVATDVDEAQGKKVADEINEQGGEAIFIKHDVTKEIEWSRVIRETVERFGKLDVLVNNAGVILTKTIEDMSLDEWRWLMSVNLDGVFLGTKHAMGAMKKSGGGSIINMSSAAGIKALGRTDTSAYHASKGGVRLFTKAAAFELSKVGLGYNIRVNSVHPGVIVTELIAAMKPNEEAMKKALTDHLVGHLGEPIDVAYGVLYLASDESRFITGSELIIDGGWTAH
jgi:NAD(P)-dependent dehydrogenase (short-subunit alcohol dehydrogenase family)